MFDRSGSRKYLNDPERRAFFRAAQEEPDVARKAFCLTLYYTGCRISEALHLVGTSIDDSQQSLVFETLKRRRRLVFRSVPIPDTLLALLTSIRKLNDDGSTPLWKSSRPTAYRLIKDCMKRAGIAGAMACPKGLRHGFAVACVSKNIPPPTLQKWLGHARLETTAIYLGVSGNEERDLARRIWANDRGA